MTKRMDELTKQFDHLIRNVRPRELREKLGNTILALVEETAKEATVNANNPILNAMKKAAGNE